MTGRPSHPSLMTRLMFGEFSYRGLGSAVIKTVNKQGRTVKQVKRAVLTSAKAAQSCVITYVINIKNAL